MSIEIREEKDTDRAAIHALNAEAFPTDAEARLVDALRAKASPTVSLVAVDRQDLVGHLMFSPVTLDAYSGLKLMGLAPMAVAPTRQRSGIGTLLVKAGLERCGALGIGAVVLLGHPDYYPRFGFRPASRWGIKSEYDAPDEAFMLLELIPDYLRDCRGTISYHAAFAEL